MKKKLCLLLATILSFGVLGTFASCAKADYGENTVVVYKEYNGLVGDGAAKVKAALEEKFRKDTGESIDLRVETTPTSLLADKISGALSASADRIDAIMAHNSSDSLVTQLIGNDKELKDITEVVNTYAPNYVALTNTDSDKTVYRRGLSGGKLYSVNSAENNSIFAMAINKTHMANTSFDPEKYDIANDSYESLTIDEFTKLLNELRANNSNVTRPLAAAPYDLEYFIAPVFENCGYTHMQKVGDRIYPAYATESYRPVLEYERMLQTERLWIENPTNTAATRRDFMAGKHSIFISYPDVEQEIDIVRELKETTGDDCIMIAPLKKDADSEPNGNARHETPFCGLVVPRKGQNTELLFKFINWMYSDKANYELAKYGIEGEHWVKSVAPDGSEGYAYPEGKAAEYEKSAPYDGVYCLLSNVNVSDRVYTGYTERENKWISATKKFVTYPAEGYADEGMNIPAVPKSERNLLRLATKMGNEYVKVRAYSWSDATIPDGKTIAQLHGTFMDNVRGDYAEYIDWINEHYRQIMNSYNQ